MIPDVSPIPIEDKPVLRQMFELYRYDFSAFDGRDLSDHGWYDYGYLDHYWTDDDRIPFMIRMDDKLAGFALVRHIADTDRDVMSLAEFFYRRQGVGEAAARDVFTRFPGKWTLSINANNLEGMAFWPRILARILGCTTSEHPSPRPGSVIHEVSIPTTIPSMANSSTPVGRIGTSTKCLSLMTLY